MCERCRDSHFSSHRSGTGALNNAKWRGHVLRISIAKESYTAKLQKEWDLKKQEEEAAKAQQKDEKVSHLAVTPIISVGKESLYVEARKGRPSAARDAYHEKEWKGQLITIAAYSSNLDVSCGSQQAEGQHHDTRWRR